MWSRKRGRRAPRTPARACAASTRTTPRSPSSPSPGGGEEANLARQGKKALQFGFFDSIPIGCKQGLTTAATQSKPLPPSLGPKSNQGNGEGEK